MDSNKGFLYWRYKFTYAYKERKYTRRYDNLHKRYHWDSNYWKRPEYILEKIIETLLYIGTAYSVVLIVFLIDTGGVEGYTFMNILLVVPLLVCIGIMVFWTITGTKAIELYGPPPVEKKVIVKEEYKPKVYTEEEREEYTSFWENAQNEDNTEG